ncbi:hypothetical protein E3Q13_01643 [Wallemia mellicola]|nr:hypothetical protein E3Q13_01643 [Wallemia mellicola]
MSSKNPNKKSKITRAKTRKKKIRCNADQTYPEKCTNCKTIECTYNEANRGYHNPSYVNGLESKLKQTENLLEDYKRLLEKHQPIQEPQSTPINHTEAAEMDDGFYVDEMLENCRKMGCLLGDGQRKHTHPEKQRFFGKASMRGLIERLNIYTGVSPVTLLSGKRPQYWQEDFVLDDVPSHPTASYTDNDFGPNDLVKELIDLYFEKVNSTLPLLNKKRFKNEISHRKYERGFGTLLILICALGAQYSNDERVMVEGHQHQFLAGFRYYSIAKSKMLDPVMDVATIEDIQALILLQIYVQKGMHSRSGWMIHGTSILLAQDIGLHLRWLNANIEPYDLELRKRAFYSLYLMDRVQASSFGRQVLLKDNEISVDLPEIYGDEVQDMSTNYSLLYFKQLIQLYKIHGQIIQTIYKLRKTSNGDDLLITLTDIASLNSKLNKWLTELPKQLLDGRDGKDEFVFQLFCNLKLAFHVVQIHLYKTFLPDPRSKTTSSFRFTSLVICANSSRSIISIYRNLILERGMQHLWVDPMVAWGPFSATLILIISACESMKNDFDASVLEYIQSGIQILRVREEREVLNGRAVDMIMQILKSANLPMDPSFMQAQENLSYGTSSADYFLPHLPFLDTPPNQTENEQLFEDLLGQAQFHSVDAASLGIGGTPPLDNVMPDTTQDWSNVLGAFLSGGGTL